ncbi:MAG: hypothetical protein EZS28_036690, partial [Streblomastix strix]
SVIKVQDIIGIGGWIQTISFSHVWLNATTYCTFEFLGSVDTQRGRIALYWFANKSRVGSRFHQRNRICANCGNSKLKQPLRIIHISDTHIRSRSQSFLDKVVQQLNEHQGDIICITGDLVDSVIAISEVIPDYQDNQLSDKSVLQPNPYPVLRSLEKLTAKVGVHLVIECYLYIIIEFMINPHKRAWLKAIDPLYGDRFLAGHTHNGQIFPGNLLVYLFFPHPAGTGTWGSPARSSGFSEITIINISPE